MIISRKEGDPSAQNESGKMWLRFNGSSVLSHKQQELGLAGEKKVERKVGRDEKTSRNSIAKGDGTCH